MVSSCGLKKKRKATIIVAFHFMKRRLKIETIEVNLKPSNSFLFHLSTWCSFFPGPTSQKTILFRLNYQEKFSKHSTVQTTNFDLKFCTIWISVAIRLYKHPNNSQTDSQSVSFWTLKNVENRYKLLILKKNQISLLLYRLLTSAEFRFITIV